MDQMMVKELDKLKLIFNKSLGGAVEVFGEMLSRHVTVTTPVIKVINFSDLGYVFGGSNKIISAVYSAYTGEGSWRGEMKSLSGRMLLSFKIESAYEMVSILTEGLEVPLDRLDEMTNSIFSEIGNVFSTSFLSTLANTAGVKLRPDVPSVINYKASSILEYVKSRMTDIKSPLLLMQTALSSDGHIVEGSFMLIPDDVNTISILLTNMR